MCVCVCSRACVFFVCARALCVGACSCACACCAPCACCVSVCCVCVCVCCGLSGQHVPRATVHRVRRCAHQSDTRVQAHTHTHTHTHPARTTRTTRTTPRTTRTRKSKPSFPVGGADDACKGVFAWVPLPLNYVAHNCKYAKDVRFGIAIALAGILMAGFGYSRTCSGNLNSQTTCCVLFLLLCFID